MVRNIVGSSRHLGLAPCGMRVYSVAKSCPTLCNPKDSSPWSIDQAPLSMEFSRQEYWSRFAIFLLQVIFLTRDWTHMSCTGRQILYHWATREACRRRIRCLVHPKRLGAEGRDWVSPTSKGIIYFSLSEGKVEEMEVRGRGAESKVEFIWILTRVFPLWIKKLDISGKPGEALSGSSWVQSWEREGKDHTFEIAILCGREFWVAVTDLMLLPASVHFIIFSLINSRGFPGRSLTGFTCAFSSSFWLRLCGWSGLWGHVS